MWFTHLALNIYYLQISVIFVCVFYYKNVWDCCFIASAWPSAMHTMYHKSLTDHSQIHLCSRVSVTLPSHISSPCLSLLSLSGNGVIVSNWKNLRISIWWPNNMKDSGKCKLKTVLLLLLLWHRSKQIGQRKEKAIPGYASWRISLVFTDGQQET